LVAQWEWIEEDDFDLEYSKDTMHKLTSSLPYLFSSLEQSCYGNNYNFYREFYSFDFSYKVAYEANGLTLFSTENNSKIKTIELGLKLKDCFIKIWSLESLELLATLESGFSSTITAVDCSSDSKKIFVSSKEGNLLGTK
jgi:WD40 repeat protein